MISRFFRLIGKVLLGLLLIIIVVASILFLSKDVLPDFTPNNVDFSEAAVVRVLDGDTIIVRYEGQDQRVRLIGINCPEMRHEDGTLSAPGAAAYEFTSELLPEGTTVYLQKDISNTDKYERLLRYVWLSKPSDSNDLSEVRSKMLNAQILLNGHAEAKKYAPDTKYSDIFEVFESEAWEDGSGLVVFAF